jgi:hypothetical protein
MRVAIHYPLYLARRANLIAADVQEQKLELVAEVASRVWQPAAQGVRFTPDCPWLYQD